MSSTTISPQMRIAALVGVLLIALAGSALVLMRGHSESAAVPTTPTPTAQQAAPHNTVHVVQPKVNPLLPAPIRHALGHSPLVVAGFYNPRSPVDALTLREARAGAAAAHAKFVAVSLLDDSVAGPLTALLPANELLPNPGIVIYERSGAIAYRSDGFITQAAVAQAVKDSR